MVTSNGNTIRILTLDEGLQFLKLNILAETPPSGSARNPSIHIQANWQIFSYKKKHKKTTFGGQHNTSTSAIMGVEVVWVWLASSKLLITQYETPFAPGSKLNPCFLHLPYFLELLCLKTVLLVLGPERIFRSTVIAERLFHKRTLPAYDATSQSRYDLLLGNGTHSAHFFSKPSQGGSKLLL